MGREMGGCLRICLIGQETMPDQSAIRHRLSSERLNSRLNTQCARLAPVELERRDEVHIFDGFNMPTRKQAQGSFGKRLDAHHAGQHWSTVDLMIMQERLNLRVKCRLDCVAVVKADGCDLAHHGSYRRRSFPCSL